MTTPLIAVDWGSTNFRASLVIEGEVAARVESPDGLKHRDGREFDDILAAVCGPWKQAHPKARVLMSGMVGSREGWREAPYVAAPAGVTDLATNLITVPSATFGKVSIVPGVRFDRSDGGVTDVMRGEETQVAGLLKSPPAEGAAVCLPGTHSKWVLCREGRIAAFRTWLTGEAFDLLTRGSLIAGTGGAVDPESEAFARGLELSGGEGGLLHHLFLGRTEMLMRRVDPADLRSLISGMLIGHEIREARIFSANLPICLVGESPAAKATAAGLGWFGIPFDQVTADIHLKGILAIDGLRE